MRILFVGFVAALAGGLCGCSPAQLAAGAQLNCALAADGSTVVAIARPGLALPAAAGAKIGCDAGTQIGQALAVTK